MTKYAIDTNLYIRAIRSREDQQALETFLAEFLPFVFLHAVVVQELLVGAGSAERLHAMQRDLVTPFERRGRLLIPSYRAWRRTGEIITALLERKFISRGGYAPSFLNDILIASSCREAGVTLVTENTADFGMIAQVERFAYVPPWPVLDAAP